MAPLEHARHAACERAPRGDRLVRGGGDGRSPRHEAATDVIRERASRAAAKAIEVRPRQVDRLWHWRVVC
eukprot:2178748-Prymnesium_polylepis.1